LLLALASSYFAFQPLRDTTQWADQPTLPRNRAPDQLSFAKSLVIIGAAGALNFLIGAPATPEKGDQPFGEAHPS
jgi:hypothetical protein